MARKGYLTASFTLPDGKRKYVYAKTQEELDKKVFDLKLQLHMGVDLSDQTTVGELIQLWYTAEAAPGVKCNTANNIKGVINRNLLPLCSAYRAKEVTPVMVKLWLNETGKLNKNAAKICLRALKGAFQLAEENGVVLKSPVLDRYKPGGFEYKKREALSPAEEEMLLDAVEGTRAYLFVWFALATGARRGEICGLKWDCVDLEKATVHLCRNLVFLGFRDTELRDVMKTSSSDRVIPIPLDLRDALALERSHTKSLFVFSDTLGRPYYMSTFHDLWRIVDDRFGPKAKTTNLIKGIKTEQNVTPHVLRHTYATRCFEAGMDIKEVQYLMGHSDPSVTLGIYTHYCKKSREEATFEKARTARQRTTVVPQGPVAADFK